MVLKVVAGLLEGMIVVSFLLSMCALVLVAAVMVSPVVILHVHWLCLWHRSESCDSHRELDLIVSVMLLTLVY